MVYGIGCDLCSIARMEKSLLGPHGAVFARRVFGPAEQAALGLPLAEEEGTARRTAHTVASAAAGFAQPGCNGRCDHGGAVPVADLVLDDEHRPDAALFRAHHR